VDINNPCFDDHIEAVNAILYELDLGHIPRLLVFNKEDRLSQEEVEAICGKYDGVSISALRPESLGKFFLALERKLWETNHLRNETDHVVLTNEDSSDISNKNLSSYAEGHGPLSRG
jgi:50S ribosomal subunit-associated GTPase HflX